MKKGELVILWIGGLLSIVVLIASEAPTRASFIRGEQPIAAAYFINAAFRLVGIWIVCGLAWLTLYKRKEYRALSSSLYSVLP